PHRPEDRHRSTSRPRRRQRRRARSGPRSLPCVPRAYPIVDGAWTPSGGASSSCVCCAPVKRIILAALLTTACGTSPTATPPSARSAQVAEGAQLYARYCALCHGDEGQGYAADNATRLSGDG